MNRPGDPEAGTLPVARPDILRQRARVVEAAGGTGRVVLLGNSARLLAPYLREWPAERCAVSTTGVDAWVVVEHIDDLSDVTALAESIAQCSADRLVVVLSFPAALAEAMADAGSDVRSEVERIFIERDWRKHPATYLYASYETMGSETDSLIALFEPIPGAALSKFPLAGLRRERDLHMDMLREPGVRSDAHAMRYEWAAGLIRPGDRVLDAACGLGYGSHVLAARTRLSNVLGIDGSEYAIAYGEVNYGSSSVQFSQGSLPDALDGYADGLFDVIVSFETLEHVPDPEALLAAFHRVLAPGGRIVVSVPNDWADESGEDPNPHHLHVYNWAMLEGQLDQHFIVEESWQQVAGGCKQGEDRVWRPSPRRLRKIPGESTADTDAEWWLASAMKSPLEDAGVPYRETVHPHFMGTGHLVDFGEHYERPWIVHAMVEIPYRLRDPAKLENLARRLLGQVDFGSADAGAALTILGYRILENRASDERALDAWDADCARYLALDAAERPHMRRWQLSLSYLRGRMLVVRGQSEAASRAYGDCLEFSVADLTPTLGTKLVDAAFRLGILHYVRGDLVQARQAWSDGLRRGGECLSDDWLQFVGNEQSPYEFSMNDAVEIADLAARCGAALRVTDADRRVASLQLATVTRTTLRAGLARMTEDFVALSMENQRLDHLVRSVVLDRDDALRHLKVAESLSNERSNALSRTEAALAAAERIAFKRLGEIERLDGELRQATTLLAARAEEVRLEAQARTTAERFATDRLAELQVLSSALDASNELAAGRLDDLHDERKARTAAEAIVQSLQSDVVSLSRALEHAEQLAMSRLGDLEVLTCALDSATNLALQREAMLQTVAAAQQQSEELLAARTVEVERVADELRTAQLLHQSAEKEIADLREELRRVMGSFAWKLGAPVRFAKAWMRGEGKDTR